METEIRLDFFASCRLLAELVVNAGHGHVRFRVGGIDACRFAEFRNGCFGTFKISCQSRTTSRPHGSSASSSLS